LFVLWLDAHPDCHSLMTTQSGHLHGVPLAYVSGQSGFSEFYPALETAVDPAHIGIFGLRSIDAAEQAFLDQSEIQSVTMDQIRAQGIGSLLDGFLDQVRQANGMLHVSFDVDWLDPLVAPAVGTPVVNGVTMSEASEVMTRLQASGLVSSLDLVEFNPDCDEGERTAEVVITLLAQLLGRCEGLKQAA
jgi:arginase